MLIVCWGYYLFSVPVQIFDDNGCFLEADGKLDILKVYTQIKILRLKFRLIGWPSESFLVLKI